MNSSKQSQINKINASKRGNISGSNNPNFGNKWTEEQKLSLSTKRKGKNCGANNSFYKKHHTEKTKKLLSELRLGKSGYIPSLEECEEIRKRQLGINNSMYGMKGKLSPRFGTKGKLCPAYGKPPAHSKRIYYDSPFQGIVCFRSSWEAAYAKYLDLQNILWFYELETFELSGNITYTPDFFLPQQEKFVEIKGRLWGIGSIKYEKIKEEYPFNIDILFKQDLKNLGVI